MLTAKPHPAGKPAELDGSDKMTELQDLATLPGAELIPAQDFGKFGNPDAAAGKMAAVPGCMEGAPTGPMRSENVSGQGALQKTAQTSAPKRNPFPRP